MVVLNAIFTSGLSISETIAQIPIINPAQKYPESKKIQKVLAIRAIQNDWHFLIFKAPMRITIFPAIKIEFPKIPLLIIWCLIMGGNLLIKSGVLPRRIKATPVRDKAMQDIASATIKVAGVFTRERIASKSAGSDFLLMFWRESSKLECFLKHTARTNSIQFISVLESLRDDL